MISRNRGIGKGKGGTVVDAAAVCCSIPRDKGIIDGEGAVGVIEDAAAETRVICTDTRHHIARYSGIGNGEGARVIKAPAIARSNTCPGNGYARDA